jgi:hypothetical protein
MQGACPWFQVDWTVVKSVYSRQTGSQGHERAGETPEANVDSLLFLDSPAVDSGGGPSPAEGITG